ncbi:MAG: pilus assembly protein, partial [Agromyces sp.]|nr:pilus assembly protein [Agromyces sp.]
MVPLSAVAPLGVGLGVILGLGLWLVLAAVPRIGRPRLMERVAPYVADLSPEARSLIGRRSADPTPVLGLVVMPAARQFRSLVSAWLGGNEVIARRLRQAGSQATVERFRAEQLTWAAAAFAIASALALVAPTFTGLPAVVRVAFPF